MKNQLNDIIKKVYFPREILPISTVTSGVVNFAISCIIIVLFALLDGVGISWHIVFLPLIMILQYIFSLSLVFITASINVYIKDVEYMVNFILNLLFYATPILYSADMFKGTKFSWIFKINPMAYLVESYRNIFYAHHIPGLKSMLFLFILGIILLIISYTIFKKLEKRFAEEI